MDHALANGSDVTRGGLPCWRMTGGMRSLQRASAFGGTGRDTIVDQSSCRSPCRAR